MLNVPVNSIYMTGSCTDWFEKKNTSVVFHLTVGGWELRPPVQHHAICTPRISEMDSCTMLECCICILEQQFSG